MEWSCLSSSLFTRHALVFLYLWILWVFRFLLFIIRKVGTDYRQRLAFSLLNVYLLIWQEQRKAPFGYCHRSWDELCRFWKRKKKIPSICIILASLIKSTFDKTWRVTYLSLSLHFRPPLMKAGTKVRKRFNWKHSTLSPNQNLILSLKPDTLLVSEENISICH